MGWRFFLLNRMVHRYGAEATNKDIMRKLGQGILPTAHNSARTGRRAGAKQQCNGLILRAAALQKLSIIWSSYVKDGVFFQNK